MQLILQNHITQLEIALTRKLTDIVTQIVNEDQYHTVNRAYFDTFNNKGNAEISNLNQRAANAVANVRTNGDAVIAELRTRYETSFNQLTQNLNQSNQLKTDVTSLQNTINEMKNEMFWLRIGSVAGVLAAAVFVFARYEMR